MSTPRPLSPDELETMARLLLPGAVYDWVAGGAGSESSVAANASAFDRLRLVPRALRDVSTVDLATTLLGSNLSAPIIVAPVGIQTLIAPTGERATAAAAASAGVLFTLSTASGTAIEDLTRSASGPRWFQLYWQADRAITASIVERAADAGYSAIVLTIDSVAHGVRWRDLRHAFRYPPDVRLAILDTYSRQTVSVDAAERRSVSPVDSGELALTWQSLAWLRSVSPLPLVLKGIISTEDAAAAVDAGVDAIWVSNHGGRQLDRLPGTLDVLPWIVDAVAMRIPIIVDGGFRSAPDIALALAVGATAVAIGRPVIWALATGGEPGVETYLRGLVTDLERTLRLLGTTSPRALDRTSVCRVDGSPLPALRTAPA